MKKGKYGVCLWFYAMVAFVLAFLGQTLLCGLLLGFVILAERDAWLSRQVIQAFFLSIFSSCITSIFSILTIFNVIPILGGIITGILGIISGLVSLLVLIIAGVALVRVCQDEEADVPLLGKLANRALGYVARTVYTDSSSDSSADS